MANKKQSTAKPKTAAPKFSLVPAAAQHQMYRVIRGLSTASFADASGAEVAEIAVCLAVGEKDPVVLCHPGRGARAARKSCVAAKSTNDGRRLTAATISAVSALLQDATATAVVCAGRLRKQDDYRSAFGFAARYKLPILYLVGNSLTPGKAQALDLRTLYAEFGIPVFSIDGNDAIAAYRVTTEALHNARHGRGPCVIEALTFERSNISKAKSLELLQGYMERHNNWPL